MPIGVDDTRHGMALSTQGFGQEVLCCGRVLLGREQEVDCRTARVHRPIKVVPLAFDPDVRLIHSPTVVGRSKPRSPSALNFRRVTLDPPPEESRGRPTVRARQGVTPRHGRTVKSAGSEPTASRIIFGSNWRHLDSPQTEEARRSIRPAYYGLRVKLQHCPLKIATKYDNELFVVN